MKDKDNDILTPSYRLGYDYGFYFAMCNCTGTKSRREEKEEKVSVSEFIRGYEVGKKEGLKMYSK